MHCGIPLVNDSLAVALTRTRCTIAPAQSELCVCVLHSRASISASNDAVATPSASSNTYQRGHCRSV
eukprot:6202237-Alexandrium_andersonii.AAC.1